MTKTKENKGITLISLVITIIILLILATVGISSGVNVIKRSKLNKFTAEMKAVQATVNELYEKLKDGEDVTSIGKDIEEVSSQADKVFTSSASGITSKDGYKYFDKSTLKELGLDNIDSEFFVNISTRSVVSYEGLQYDGTTYYTLNRLPSGLYNVEKQEKTQITVEAISVTTTYDGKVHTAGLKQTEFTIDDHTYTVTGLTTDSSNAKNVGEYNNNIIGTAIVKDENGNDVTNKFEINKINGKIVINKAVVTLKSGSASKEYDGEALICNKLEIEERMGRR